MRESQSFCNVKEIEIVDITDQTALQPKSCSGILQSLSFDRIRPSIKIVKNPVSAVILWQSTELQLVLSGIFCGCF
jgi:hypothetical protein